MSERKKKKTALIREHMLEPDFRKKIRLNDKLIGLDDLTPEIRKKITNIALNEGTAYDDNELRERITNLENGGTTLGEVFVKDLDKVSRKDLDYNAQVAYDRANEVPELQEKKADKEYVDENFRKKAIPVIQGDFDPLLQKKLNDMQANLNSIMANFDSNSGAVTSVQALEEAVKNLSTTKVEKTYVDKTFRKAIDQISLSDVDSTIAEPVNSIPQMQKKLDDAAMLSDLENYRPKADQIRMEDMTNDLRDKLKKVFDSADDAKKAAEESFKENFDSYGITQILDRYGDLICTDPVNPHVIAGVDQMSDMERKFKGIYPFSLAVNITKYIGTYGIGESNPLGGRMSFSGAINYLYDLIMKTSGDESPFGLFLNSGKKDIKKLRDELDALTETVETMQGDIEDLQTENTALKERVKKLEDSSSSGSDSGGKK